MLIEYVGHSCFYIKNKEGVRIIIDPYDNSIGLAPVSREADILLVTHHHYDHDYVDGVRGRYTLIDKPGDYCEQNVVIKGVELPHDASGGSERGKVVAYVIETDGIRILHMGDVGDIPCDDFFASVGKPDILMIPVGGFYTINASQAVQIMERLDANITIPMHYKTTHLKLDISTVHEFIRLVKRHYDVAHLGSSYFDIDAANLKKRGRVLLMENSFLG